MRNKSWKLAFSNEPQFLTAKMKILGRGLAVTTIAKFLLLQKYNFVRVAGKYLNHEYREFLTNLLVLNHLIQLVSNSMTHRPTFILTNLRVKQSKPIWISNQFRVLAICEFQLVDKAVCLLDKVEVQQKELYLWRTVPRNNHACFGVGQKKKYLNCKK